MEEINGIHTCSLKKETAGNSLAVQWLGQDDWQQQASGPGLVRPGEQWNHSGRPGEPSAHNELHSDSAKGWHRDPADGAKEKNRRLLISQCFCNSKINQATKKDI